MCLSFDFLEFFHKIRNDKPAIIPSRLWKVSDAAWALLDVQDAWDAWLPSWEDVGVPLLVLAICSISSALLPAGPKTSKISAKYLATCFRVNSIFCWLKNICTVQLIHFNFPVILFSYLQSTRLSTTSFKAATSFKQRASSRRYLKSSACNIHSDLHCDRKVIGIR